jgi:hypothetical protein
VKTNENDPAVFEALAGLTDTESEDCLYRVLSEASVMPADYRGLIAATDFHSAVIFVPTEAGNQAFDAANIPTGIRSKLVRMLLRELARDPRYAGVVLTHARTMSEDLARTGELGEVPLKRAIIIAGIITVLSTGCDVHFKHDQQTGTSVEVTAKKTPASDDILRRFTDLLPLTGR